MTDVTTAPVADSAPLSIEQAVKRHQELRAAAVPTKQPAETEADAAPVEAEPEIEAAPQAVDDAQEEPTEANLEGEQQDEAEPAPPAIEPPEFWDTEGKEHFAKLPPSAQQAVLEYEKQRTKAVAKAMQEAATVRKTSEAKLKQLDQVIDTISAQVADEAAYFDQWEEWLDSPQAQQLRSADLNAYNAEIARYQAEKLEYTRKQDKLSQAERLKFEQFATEQAELLKTVAPELVDPKEGRQRWADMTTHLHKLGVPNEQIRTISALEASIAYKAMLWDRAQAKAKETPKPKPKPAGPSVSPAGQGRQGSTSDARIKQLNSKHSLTIDEAMELRRLKRS